MLLGTLGASLLGNLLTGGKGMIRTSEGKRSKKKPKFFVTISFINKHRNIVFIQEIIYQKQYILKNSALPYKKGAYIISLDEYENKGTH